MVGANFNKNVSNMALTENTMSPRDEKATIEEKSGIHLDVKENASDQSQTNNVRNSHEAQSKLQGTSQMTL